jgi:hypothetical protein
VNSYQLNKEAAELAHARSAAWRESLNGQAAESSHNAIKAAGIINGGAVVALLALVGNIVDKEAATSVSADHIGFAMLVFVAGLAASAFASGFSYFTIYLYVVAGRYRTWDYTHPYVHETRKSKIHTWFGALFHITAVVLVLGSYSLFVYGAYVSKELITTTWAGGYKAPQGTTPPSR